MTMTVSRLIEKIDADVRGLDGFLPTLREYSNAITQACPHYSAIL